MSEADPTAIRTMVHGAWSRVADRWSEHAEYIDARSAELTGRMLDAVELRLGDRVLELACGAGGTGIAAARRLAGSGTVVLSDVAPEMVAHAAARAHALKLTNIESRTIDLEHIDEPDASFDVVLCREGMMFAADPGRAAGEAHRVLRSGGRLAAAVWGPRHANPWLGLVFDTVTEVIGMPVPPPGIPGPFALADNTALHSHLVQAGFTDTVVTPVDVPVHAPSFEEWWHRTREIAGPLALVLAGMDADTHAALERNLHAKAEQYESPEGIDIPGVALLAIGHA